MAALLPQVGVRGVFRLLTPFDTTLVDRVPYTAMAVRRLSDIVAAGEDPETLYYTPAGLTSDQYKADVAAGVCIVSLQSDSGIWTYVPHTYIAGAPEVGGVPYTTMVLAVSLGAIPDSMNLDYIKSRIADMILENIGVTSEVKPVAISATTIIPTDEHVSLEAARQSQITNSETDYARLLAVTAQRDSCYLKIAELESYILNHP